MAFPYLTRQPKKREHIVAIDLGAHATKGVYLHNKGRYCLAQYSIQETPVSERGVSKEVLADLIKKVVAELGARTRQVTLVMNVGDSMLKQIEMPMVPVNDMRMMLKLNSKNYLQQDLPDHVFDCFVLPNYTASTGTESKDAPKSQLKAKVMVGGARRQLVDDYQAAIKAAGMVPDQIVPNLIGATNAFELAEPEAFQKEVVAVVDLGFKHSTISILSAGELMLNRVVGLGGDKLTSGLAEVMNTSYAEAEGIKVGMPQEVESALLPLLTPLGRELRISIDFFEHKQERTVSQVYVSGGAARSEFIMQALQNEMMIPCKSWNPVSFLELTLPADKLAEIERVSSQLAVAVGAAISCF
jgi:type IV pilus assembly protein PilM